VFNIHLPPLRDHKEDIPQLVESLLREMRAKHDRDAGGVSDIVMEMFKNYNWPGNVRELRNVLERAVILAGEGTVEMKHLPATFQTGAPVAVAEVQPEAGAPDHGLVHFSIGTTVEEAEKGLILRTLEHTKNNKTRAAEILGISLKTLHNKLKEYGSREIVTGV
jgi:DNA-binding NtrC family response regulator